MITDRTAKPGLDQFFQDISCIKNLLRQIGVGRLVSSHKSTVLVVLVTKDR